MNNPENKQINGHIERIVPDVSPQKYVDEHIERYTYAVDLVYGNIIDAACGVGYGSAILAQTGNPVLAVDRSQTAIDYAKENYSRENITYEVQDLDTWEIPGADTIVSFETIEHLKDPKRFIDQCLSRCNLFIFSIPLKSPITEFHLTKYDSIEDVQRLIGVEFEYWLQSEGNYLIGTWRS